MQTLTLDQAALLVGDRLEVSAGCDVLDLDLNVTGDISDHLVAGTIARNMRARIHGTCSLDLSTDLAWGTQLVRPYMTLSDGDVSERFNVGVFMLTTPEQVLGDDLPVRSTDGFDRLYLLDREVADDYVRSEGETYYEALVQVFDDAGLTGFLIDGAAADYTLPVDREWPLVARSTDPDQTSSPVTWLRVVNDLLTAINFRGVWADENGLYRCQQYLAPAARSPEFTFDVDNIRENIVVARTVIEDQWKTPNRWVFLWQNRPGGMSSTPGDGLYERNLDDDHPLSAVSRDLDWPKVYSYEAASQAVLEELGDRRVADDLGALAVYKVTTGPFPAAGHWDVVTYADDAAGGSVKAVATDWELDLSGGDMSWTWEAVS